MNCTGDDYTCWKANFKTDKDKTGEIRGCVPKKSCEEIKKKCDDGEEIDQGDGEKITKCDAACCVTAEGAENPCNDAILSQQTKSPGKVGFSLLKVSVWLQLPKASILWLKPFVF